MATGPAAGAVLGHLLSQRACRAYAADPVPDDDLATILRAATHAPSAENRQPWVFVVVRDPLTRAAVAEHTRRLWDAGGRGHARQSLAPPLFAGVDRFMTEGYGAAPVLVVVAGDGRDGLPPAAVAASVFPAVQNVLLAAAALGYGSALTTLAAHDPAGLATLVDLPDGVHPLAVVPLGHPAARLGPPRRRPLADVAHLDRYGTPFAPVTGPHRESAVPPPPARPPA